MRRVKLRGQSEFEQALLTGYITGHFCLPDQYVLDFHFDNYWFDKCVIRHGSLSCSIFQQSNLDNVSFFHVDCAHTRFVDCSFNNVKFVSCMLENISFERCIGQITMS
jgi:hypothetical protein